MLELGCGTGLLGCVISHVCSHVTLTDHHSAVVDTAEHTVQANSVLNAEVGVLDWNVGLEEGRYADIDIIVAAGVLFYTL